jgi:hypothetical protein
VVRYQITDYVVSNGSTIAVMPTPSSVHSNTTISSATTSSMSTSSTSIAARKSLSASAKTQIAIGVSIPLLFIVLAFIGTYLFFRRRHQLRNGVHEQALQNTHVIAPYEKPELDGTSSRAAIGLTVLSVNDRPLELEAISDRHQSQNSREDQEQRAHVSNITVPNNQLVAEDAENSATSPSSNALNAAAVSVNEELRQNNGATESVQDIDTLQRRLRAVREEQQRLTRMGDLHEEEQSLLNQIAEASHSRTA